MKILLLAVGGARGPLKDAVDEYRRRASRYWKLEVLSVEAGAPGTSPARKRVLAEEGRRLEERVPPGSQLWVLTREGRQLTSLQWAQQLGERAAMGGRDLTLIVGGAFGVDDALSRGAHRRISLGAITLPHEMAQLVLLEQLYRAGTILRNEPYHKGGG